MKKRSKRYQETLKLVELAKRYRLVDAIKILKQVPRRKFDETLELHFQLGIKPGETDEVVRGSAGLPHGSGKKVRVVCFCKGEATREAQEAGAEHVGAEELVSKIQGGWMDFDSVVAHPDMMREVSKLGKLLGPKGLMPTPKTGTVTVNVAKAIKEIKAGRVDFKSDKTGGLHVACGKLSFEEAALLENAQTVIQAVFRAKPQGARSEFVKHLCASSTQGPGLTIDLSSVVSKEAE